jgi:hypothetical protein
LFNFQIFFDAKGIQFWPKCFNVDRGGDFEKDRRAGRADGASFESAPR